ncbi:MAG: GIY-YIG nuclease family protein [Terracidiphilus sp.]
MAFVYVLRSTSTGGLYTGATTDLDRRLLQHNLNLSRSTKNRGPWVLVHKEEVASLADAYKRERFLKTGKGRDELRRILNDAKLLSNPVVAVS